MITERDELFERLDFTVRYNVLEHLLNECNESMLVEIVIRVDEANQDWGFTLNLTKRLFAQCMELVGEDDDFQTKESMIEFLTNGESE